MPCSEKSTNLQGIVIAHNVNLWRFELDRNRVVYMPHLAAFEQSPSLPAIASSVIVNHAHYEPIPPYFIDQQPKIYYLCPESRLDCNCFVVNKPDSRLLDLIKQHTLTAGNFKNLLNRMQNEFARIIPEEDRREEFAFCVYETLARNKKLCDFDAFEFKTISQCKFINSKIDLCRTKMPYWSFGCHPSGKNEILMGVFKILNDYGVFLLSDCDYEILCVLQRGGDWTNLWGLVGKFVFITDYVVFTETYQGYNRGVDYLICHVNNVHVINFDEGGTRNFNERNETACKVLLLKKSMPMLNLQSKPYFVLQIENEKNERLFFAMKNLQIYQFLQIGCIYFLTHNQPPVEITNYELKRLFPNCTCYEIDANFEFHTRKFEETPLNITQAMLALKTDTSLIDFEAVINEKDFCKPLESRTKRTVNVLAYGTPGKKTHLLYFKTENYGEDSVALYLNNWETIQMPFGLLPSMRILVRNVLPQKRKYFKSTILTSFEILNYTPKINFQTANLRTEDGYDGNWGSPFNFGTGYLIPNAVLIYSQVRTVKIRSLKLYYACAICPKSVLNCSTHDLTLQSTMTMIVTDSGGKAMVICKSLEVLRVVLDVPQSQWGQFCASMKTIESYQYDKFAGDVEPLNFSSALTTIINLINEIGLIEIDMLCRKLDSKLEDNDRLPLWLCVDARRK